MAMTSHNQSPSDMFVELDSEWMQKLFEGQADARCFNEIHEVFQQPLAQCTGSGWGTGEIRAGLSEPPDDATITEQDEVVDQSLVIQALTERVASLESQVRTQLGVMMAMLHENTEETDAWCQKILEAIKVLSQRKEQPPDTDPRRRHGPRTRRETRLSHKR
ncbi:hypothetical protein TSTA_081760 [Talaromyces stipitatus ATCC 10500]|uniref:Uncharacterized protein n=1 Tax=Talaromyces stipitatus (strain ATCC 10500 / CBS 375.48 / QM 6759 / NRRL 1006) TaxID=441959 RepID=B8M011_TALSN|nr:uncharacterized protein TSTA_081760 [Talaromyces stipitatus ATCC 10500]EED20943.1 hypothetical protein TSTA_081760 [Talaromyces stipitatus ATCC 10500]